jgi:hypothetical protein
MKKNLLTALALTFISSGAWANSLTFQGVTFSTTDLGGGALELSITNALNATGNWSGIKYLEAFSISNVGSFTTAGVAGFTFDSGGLSNGSAVGCNGSGSGGCFTAASSPLALTNNMVFDIAFAGGSTNFSLPHLKVDFWASPFQTKATGDLLSQSIGPTASATPLPSSSVLLMGGLAAFALFGWLMKRRSRGFTNLRGLASA